MSQDGSNSMLQMPTEDHNTTNPHTLKSTSLLITNLTDNTTILNYKSTLLLLEMLPLLETTELLSLSSSKLEENQTNSSMKSLSQDHQPSPELP